MASPVIDLEGLRAISASLLLPRVGVWIADVIFDEPASLAGFVVLKLGGLELRGTVDPFESGTFQLQTRVRLVGGRMGWRKIAPAKHFHSDGGVKVSSVLLELAATVGETLVGAPSGVLSADYVRPRAVASATIRRLAPVWWVDAEGVTRTAEARASSEAAAAWDLIRFDPQASEAELAFDELAGIGVGTILRSPRLERPILVNSLELAIDKSIRARAWVEELAA